MGRLDEDEPKFSLSLIQNDVTDRLGIGGLSNDANIVGACCKLNDRVEMDLGIVVTEEEDVEEEGDLFL